MITPCYSLGSKNNPQVAEGNQRVEKTELSWEKTAHRSLIKMFICVFPKFLYATGARKEVANKAK